MITLYTDIAGNPFRKKLLLGYEENMCMCV